MCVLAVDIISAITLVCQLPLLLASDVQLRYQKGDIDLLEGDSMKLKCMAVYQPENCTQLSVYWCRKSIEDECVNVSEPGRQLITMNETDDPNNHGTRLRDVMFEMWNISGKDDGSYQCQASCGGPAAMGHFINLKTKNRTSAGGPTKPTNNCGSNRPNITVLLVATVNVLILWLECQCAFNRLTVGRKRSHP